MNPAELTLIVAAGGRSTRMGTDKRFLPLDGETLLAHMLRKGSAAGFHSIVLAAEGERSDLAALAEEYGAYLVTDEIPAQGPAAAIAAGLAAAKTEWALVLSGDMPFYDFELVRALLPEATGDTQVVLPTISGYWQPLAALYRRDAGTAFAAAIARGDRKLGIILRELTVKELPLTVDAGIFFNVNTPASYRLALGRLANEHRTKPILSVAAPASGTGKTTFIEKLIPLLAARGVRCAVIKSDSHGFNLDTKGKDTARFTAAGAEAVAVSSPDGYFIQQKTKTRQDFQNLIANIIPNSVDLYITESRSRGVLPTFMLDRGLGIPEIDERVAACFAKERSIDTDVLTFDLDDMDTAVRLALFLMGRPLYGADSEMFLTM
ncbi:molybdopterin-guanine dinucleotide biosynthesis protein MobB [Centipeda periodontii DSM 2778]|uniref:Probable molybdenum cofactor guanylyltransferase n=1 Tax=Centipeda periodontii DSM 2778 TaxID=888060 RepID=F5RQJ3_9FIRM|nr:molybdopterin-guanine dinucleotide biosynthesis protein B [Centipeda periodontii]EGK56916.1 molybdopterin-guanine dinucleotide biosynthesis protein MobB [Centipeda periodontii DSM 2778]